MSVQEQNVKQIGENKWIIDTKDFEVTLNDKEEMKTVNLLFHVELIDMYEATGDSFEYPYTVRINVIPRSEVSSEVKERTLRIFGLQDLEYFRPEMLVSYGYHIPVDQNILIDDIEEDFSPITGDMSLKGTELCFNNADDAVEYVTEYLPEKLNSISDMSDYILDRRINQIGDTGWDVLRKILGE